MSIVRILDEHTANQIAAGEVVERPASVVKELVENSIDAGSTVINIELEDAGLKLIRVTDNGSGMSAEDAQLALARHATSKIRSAADLQQVVTLGFRGEALPSIAAVSRLELTTRLSEIPAATRLVVEGGTIHRVEEVGAAVGTMVSVADLFFNTPARRKFLKSQSTELGHVVDLLERLMLGHPGIAWQVRHQGRVILQSAGNNNLLEVISEIYGRETARAMIPVQWRLEGQTIAGYAAQPSLTRSSRRWQAVFVNGRHISSRLVSDAVVEAYQTRLPIGRYPLVVLKLDVPPDLVDVNVHPAKLEVRFQNEGLVQQLVMEGVDQALQAAQSPVDFWEPAEATAPEETSPVTEASPEPPVAKARADQAVREAAVTPLFRELFAPANEVLQTKPARLPSESAWPRQVAEPAPAPIKPEPAEVKEISGQFADLLPLGQFRATYIIATGPAGLYIIDQHAAHERVRYETLQAAAKEAASLSQSLLFPVTLELAGEDREVLLRNILLFRDLGFVVEHFGGNTFLLREVPAYLSGDAPDYFPDLLEIVREQKWQVSSTRLQDEALKMAACKSAIKAGDIMTLAEISHLLAELDRVRQPYTCPHGRPTIFRLSPEELEKRFLRT